MFQIQAIRHNVNASQRRAFIEGMSSILDIGGVGSPNRRRFRVTVYSLPAIHPVLPRRYNNVSVVPTTSALAGDLQRMGRDLENATQQFEAKRREQLVEGRIGSAT